MTETPHYLTCRTCEYYVQAEDRCTECPWSRRNTVVEVASPLVNDTCEALLATIADLKAKLTEAEAQRDALLDGVLHSEFPEGLRL